MAKILLVEDDVFIAEIYKKKFESAGFEVVNAASGKQVLKELMENRYDVTLLDLVLPEMGGFDILHEVRTAPGYPKDVRIIIFSNLSSAEDREKAVKFGADGFISKTEHTPSKVVEEVTRYLRQFSEQTKNITRREGAAHSDGDEVSDMQPPKHSAGKQILIIEDEQVFAEMFSKRLTDEGYAVTIKENGLAGMEDAIANHYDLIITDAVLPGMMGAEIIGRLRAEESTKATPIILLSASLDEQQFKEASIGATKAFLKTQITPSEVVYEINAMLSESRA